MAVIVKPADVWGYFHENFKDLHKQYHLVADDQSEGIAIYIGAERGLPVFQVDINGETEHETECSGEDNTITEYTKILNLFADCSDMDSDDFCGFSDDENERLNRIEEAISDLLCVLTESDSCFDLGDTEEFYNMVDDFRDCICQKLYDDYGYDVWCPIIVDDKIIAFPYSE